MLPIIVIRQARRRQIHVRLLSKASLQSHNLRNSLKIGSDGARTGRQFQRAGAATKKAYLLLEVFLASFGVANQIITLDDLVAQVDNLGGKTLHVIGSQVMQGFTGKHQKFEPVSGCHRQPVQAIHDQGDVVQFAHTRYQPSTCILKTAKYNRTGHYHDKIT